MSKEPGLLQTGMMAARGVELGAVGLADQVGGRRVESKFRTKALGRSGRGAVHERKLRRSSGGQ